MQAPSVADTAAATTAWKTTAVELPLPATSAQADANMKPPLGQEQRQPAITTQLLFGFLTHGGSSVGLSLLNKALMRGLPNTLEAVLTILIVQGVFAVLAGAVLAAYGAFPFRHFSTEQIRMVAPAGALFTVLVYTGLQSLAHAPVSMVIVFRNMAPIVTFLLEGLLYRRRPDRRLFALLLILVAAVIYSSEQASGMVSRTGILWLTSNLVIGCCLNLLENHITRTLDGKQTPAGVAQLRNMTSQVFIVLLLVLTGDWSVIASAVQSVTARATMPALVASCFLGYAIGLANYVLQSLVSSTTMSVANCFYKVATVALSVILWEHALSLQGFVGIFLSFTGVLLYVYMGSR